MNAQKPKSRGGEKASSWLLYVVRSCAILLRVSAFLRGERTPDAPSPYSARPAPAGLLTGSPQFLRRCGC